MADLATTTREHDGKAVPLIGTYTIDPIHSTVGFVVRHLMVSKVRGGFDKVEGTITVGEDPGDSAVEATIDAASVSTREAQRDAHLRSADFLDVEHFPELRFVSSQVRPSDDGWTVSGQLTIRDVTRPVTLELEFNGSGRDPYGNDRAGFSAVTEIDREDFGITYNAALEAGGVVVGKTVKIELEVEAIRQAD